MKKIIILTLALALSSCATINAPAKDPKATYINLFDENNQIVASVNSGTGEVTYHQKPERAFEVLLGSYLKFAKENGAQKAKEAVKEEAKKHPAKK